VRPRCTGVRGGVGRLSRGRRTGCCTPHVEALGRGRRRRGDRLGVEQGKRPRTRRLDEGPRARCGLRRGATRPRRGGRGQLGSRIGRARLGRGGRRARVGAEQRDQRRRGSGCGRQVRHRRVVHVRAVRGRCVRRGVRCKKRCAGCRLLQHCQLRPARVLERGRRQGRAPLPKRRPHLRHRVPVAVLRPTPPRRQIPASTRTLPAPACTRVRARPERRGPPRAADAGTTPATASRP
jgi:hypothetical protein